MVSLLTALVFAFPSGQPVNYDLTVRFQGNLPLLGGKEGDVTVRMAVRVVGQPEPDGKLAAEHEITKFSAEMNDATLPFTAANVQSFFPKARVVFTPQGEVISTTAPNRKLTFRLPGLHPQRFADLTFLPLQLPKEPLRAGQEYKFTKPFGESNVDYTVTLAREDAERAEFRIKIEQRTTEWEDANGNPAEEANGSQLVTTVTTGSGTAVFSRSRSRFAELKISAESKAEVKPRTGAPFPRQLRTTLTVIEP